MKLLEGIGITVVSFIPWSYMFFYRLIWHDILTENQGELTVAALAVVVLIFSIRAYVKGYGRQHDVGSTQHHVGSMPPARKQ